MNKKIPLVVLELLQPILNENKDIIKAIMPKEGFFHLIDKDENSDFFFRVIRQEISQGHRGFVVEFKPKSKIDIQTEKSWLKHDSLNDFLNKWVETIVSYNKFQTIYDDPILKKNQERFEKQFEILDDDADTSSFNLDQQLFIDNYLNEVKSKLLLIQKEGNETQTNEISELIIDATSIQENLTKNTKNQIVQQLSKFWAKAQKIGLELIKEIFISVASDLTKKILTGGI